MVDLNRMTWWDVEYLMKKAFEDGQQSIINTPPWEDVDPEAWHKSPAKRAMEEFRDGPIEKW